MYSMGGGDLACADDLLTAVKAKHALFQLSYSPASLS
jgi:hypothetical protein